MCRSDSQETYGELGIPNENAHAAIKRAIAKVDVSRQSGLIALSTKVPQALCTGHEFSIAAACHCTNDAFSRKPHNPQCMATHNTYSA